MSKEFNLKISEAYCDIRAGKHCDAFFYDLDSLAGLAELVGVKQFGEDYHDFLKELDQKVSRLVTQRAEMKCFLKEHAVIFKVISTIKGKFDFRGVTVSVDFETSQDYPGDDLDAMGIFRKQTYRVLVNDQEVVLKYDDPAEIGDTVNPFILEIAGIDADDEMCSRIVYDEQSLAELMVKCGVLDSAGDPDGYQDNLNSPFYWELDELVRENMFQWARQYYNTQFQRKDITVTTKIRGEFVLRGVPVRVDFLDVHYNLWQNTEAQQILEDQRYMVSVNGKLVKTPPLDIDDVNLLFKALTEQANELGIEIKDFAEWAYLINSTDISDLMEDAEYGKFISFDWNIMPVRPDGTVQ